jgi:Arc/MetJ-type ribon-helix-helix transcriptional regulator
MDVHLPEELEAKLQALVAAGHFSSKEFAVELAVRASLADETLSQPLSAAGLRDVVQGETDRDGEWVSGEMAQQFMRVHSRKMREKYGDRLPGNSKSVGGHSANLESHRVG